MDFFLTIVVYPLVLILVYSFAEIFKIIFKAKFEQSIITLVKNHLWKSLLIASLLLLLTSYFLVPLLKSYGEKKNSLPAEKQPVREAPVIRPDTIPKPDTIPSSPPISQRDSVKIKVSFQANTDFEVRVGDTIFVAASGIIDQDRSFYKDMGMDSLIEEGGISLSSYGPGGLKDVSSFVKIVYRYDYGALLMKIGSDSWRFCGKRLRFVADADGVVDFLINSTKRKFGHDDQYFSVTVLVSRKK